MKHETSAERERNLREGPPPTLANYWHPIATSEEVVEQPRRFRLLDQDLVTFRDEGGVVIFKDLCIHRGSALSLGWIRDGRLTCAYHGFEYDRTGAVVRIPSLPVGHSIPAKARAIKYEAQEAYGLVWAALAEPMAPIPPWPNGEFHDPNYRTFLAGVDPWNTSAGRAVENFMDFSHFPFVHPGLLGSPDRTLIEPYEVVGTDYGLHYVWDEVEEDPLTSAEGDRVHHEYDVYFPFTAHFTKVASDGRVTIITLIASPTERRKTTRYLFICRNHSFDTDDKIFRDFDRTLMEQDRRVVESQRPEEIPLSLREELHIKVPDVASVAYRRLLAAVDQEADTVP